MTNPICWLIRPRLGAYEDGELSRVAHRKIEGHLGRCAGCAGERAGIVRLRAFLAGAAAHPAPLEPVWERFWPQVRARLSATPVVAEPFWRRFWQPVADRPRLALGSALAMAGLAALALLGPWDPGSKGLPRPGQPPGVAIGGAGPTLPIQQVVVQSVETADPQSAVMVYANPDSDFTVVWVFGLERTES